MTAVPGRDPGADPRDHHRADPGADPGAGPGADPGAERLLGRWWLATAADTDRLGRRLGAVLRAGDLLLLSGALGAGKTALTRGIGAGMRVRGTVASPTFVLARVHPPAEPGGVVLVHVDAYRLGGAAELDDLDLDTDLAQAAVVVEWGSGLAERLGPVYLHVDLDRRPDDTRLATVSAVGGDWPERVAAVVAAAQLTVADEPAGGTGAGVPEGDVLAGD
ncbi:tRNA (adenosine(37)-N6)-threonylcarbamoyltransferase complex ATPase subunit type 1 TsaE [Nakamurella endophytica]|uniref:tRNA threonylcarbamoyladenosine biosynthesis protein TsaE n=1 Tax=Nakamurella endophytica TaxID=1748367 RepID=A0A917SZ38_9ACTN|nr:tRNA (adenosine(37)-N6)-threonylcarbamoyltransferase complex ATPase subunit type 1 TsaE [Nakamurella endophytica]GGM03042.1 hypothetical protein GCM10011594_23970 [Nakamurella endophytica]